MRPRHLISIFIPLVIISLSFFGCSSSSGGGDGEVKKTIPAAPSKLSIRSVATDRISLEWQDNSSNETGFKIERSLDGKDYKEIVVTGENKSTYIDQGLNNKTEYYYRIASYNSDGKSDYCQPVHGKTESEPEKDWNPDNFSRLIDVGPGLDYETPSNLPWDTLEKSTMVRIHWRQEPYRSKWIIKTSATLDNPIVITGVPDNGRLPVITGENAVTPSGIYYLNENRSIIKFGNYKTDIPSHVFLEKLEIKTARPGYNFTDRNGKKTKYQANAAAIHIEDGNNITIKDCIIHDCGNGIMSTYVSRNISIKNNYIYDNGIEGSYYQHNTYTESNNIIYEYNRLGPLRTGCGGNNLKDRSAGTIIRYNWIKGGNRQLDLVESDHEELYNLPVYDKTFVYGNLLIEPENQGNSQIIHYGGDSGGNDHTGYRNGTLYLYNNTIVSLRSSNTTLVRITEPNGTADIKNNIIYTKAGSGRFAITGGNGIVYLENNWISEKYRYSFEPSLPEVKSEKENITGADPGFTNIQGEIFTLTANSPCIDKGGALSSGALAYPVENQYIKHLSHETRTIKNLMDIGAYEN